MTMTTISLPDGKGFEAYVARPAGLDKAPVVVVIQEIFGVNDGIRGKCDWLAENGFIAVAPDLFWRLEPGVQLTDKTKDGWDKALDLLKRFDVELGLKDLQTTIDRFRRDEHGNGKVGCMGYCLGGKVAYLMACKSDVNASVGYYGIGLEELLADAKGIQNPVMLHIAGEDKFSSKEAQKKVVDGLKDNKFVTTHVYEGQDHAFTRVGGDHYDAPSAKIADGRTIAFFKEHLA